MEKVRVTKGLTYTNVEKDADGWVDATKYMPYNFDICLLKLKDKEKIVSGWATDYKFDGLKVNPEDEVLFWKRSKEAQETIYATSKR